MSATQCGRRDGEGMGTALRPARGAAQSTPVGLLQRVLSSQAPALTGDSSSPPSAQRRPPPRESRQPAAEQGRGSRVTLPQRGGDAALARLQGTACAAACAAACMAPAPCQAMPPPQCSPAGGSCRSAWACQPWPGRRGGRAGTQSGPAPGRPRCSLRAGGPGTALVGRQAWGAAALPHAGCQGVVGRRRSAAPTAPSDLAKRALTCPAVASHQTLHGAPPGQRCAAGHVLGVRSPCKGNWPDCQARREQQQHKGSGGWVLHSPPTTRLTSARALVTVRVRATGAAACRRCTCNRQAGATGRAVSNLPTATVSPPAGSAADGC